MAAELEDCYVVEAGYLAALAVVALAAASIAVGAMAAADPVWPVAGDGSAADTRRTCKNRATPLQSMVLSPPRWNAAWSPRSTILIVPAASPTHPRPFLPRRVVPAGTWTLTSASGWASESVSASKNQAMAHPGQEPNTASSACNSGLGCCPCQRY